MKVPAKFNTTKFLQDNYKKSSTQIMKKPKNLEISAETLILPTYVV